jgi:3-deoxy-manno-octulosonate cytidylyltransferase (CMP-KDO synthetase)
MRPNVQFSQAGHSLDDVAVIIPARMAASRLPGKPLAMIGDAPMIVQVMRRAYEAGFGQEGQGRVIVACDDQMIADAVIAHGGEAIITSPDHRSGSDRVFEALKAIDPEENIDVVVNLQGDLPEIDGGILSPLVAALRQGGGDISTPVAAARDEDLSRSQVVKAAIAFAAMPFAAGDAAMPVAAGDAARPVAAGDMGRVLYFSRHPIPHGGGEAMPIWHHIGIYAWRRSALARFVALPPSPLELAENLEQLRALEDGMTITALVVDSTAAGIDTPEDLKDARRRMESNKNNGEKQP